MKQFGQFHEGTAVDIAIEYSPADSYPNNFVLEVLIRERGTGKTVSRRGLGKFIGNFSPIWISFCGEKVQLTELLRRETVDFPKY